MKKLLFTVLFCISIYAKAQQIEADESITYSEQVSKELAPLIQKDAKRYKNSIFYNKVMPLANLSEFNNNANAVTHPFLFRRAWQELNTAKVVKTNQELSVKKMKDIATHFQEQGIIPIGIINADFTQLKESTVASIQEGKTSIAKLAQRSTAVDTIKANEEDPYEDQHVFMVSPINNKVITTQTNGDVVFEIGQFVWDASHQKIKTLKVVYDGKTTVLIKKGILVQSQFTQRFTTSGVKTLQFKVVFTNREKFSQFAKFTVAKKYAARGNTPIKIKATLPFRGYDEPADCHGDCYGEGEYQVFLGDGNSKLKKPVIILDGFDPGDLREIDNGNKGIRYLINNGDEEDNIKKFREAGFDVVILNFPKYPIKTVEKIDIYRDGGADYIERNANVLKALIVELNGELQENGSDEKLKIIGPSMGGLISRVALTEMEQDHQDHNVDIWISFDSPHLGANIPVGFQYFFNFMKLEQNEDLQTPAAKQMLITHVADPTYTFRNRFKSKLSSLGFPQKTRNLALLNGNIRGKGEGTPESKTMEIDFNGLKTILGSVYRFKINTYASHNGGRYKIFQRYERFLFFKKTHTGYLIDNSGAGSLDNAPGSYYDMKNEFEEALGIKLPLENWNAGIAVSKLLDLADSPASIGINVLVLILLHNSLSSINLDIYQGKPTFIPSKSALAFVGSNNQYEDLSNRNLVCTNETPFDNYYAPHDNEGHITLNSSNMGWVLKELNGIEQLLPSYSISGSPYPFKSSQYSMASIDGATYNWRLESIGYGTSGWSISSNGRFANVSVGNNAVKIVCSVTSACLDFTVSMNLYPLEEPEDPYDPDPEDPYDPDPEPYDPDPEDPYNPDPEDPYNPGPEDPEGPGGPECEVNSLEFSSNPMKANSPSNKIYSIYPPMCLKKAQESATAKKNNLEHTISIHTMYGRTVYSKTQTTTEFNMSTLRKGIYIVKLNTKKGETISKTLVVE